MLLWGKATMAISIMGCRARLKARKFHSCGGYRWTRVYWKVPGYSFYANQIKIVQEISLGRTQCVPRWLVDSHPWGFSKRLGSSSRSTVINYAIFAQTCEVPIRGTKRATWSASGHRSTDRDRLIHYRGQLRSLMGTRFSRPALIMSKLHRRSVYF